MSGRAPVRRMAQDDASTANARTLSGAFTSLRMAMKSSVASRSDQRAASCRLVISLGGSGGGGLAGAPAGPSFAAIFFSSFSSSQNSAIAAGPFSLMAAKKSANSGSSFSPAANGGERARMEQPPASQAYGSTCRHAPSAVCTCGLPMKSLISLICACASGLAASLAANSAACARAASSLGSACARGLVRKRTHGSTGRTALVTSMMLKLLTGSS